jgi:hypothetical protein
MFRDWLARRVVAATLREAARAIEQAAEDLQQPWARDLSLQLRTLAQHITSGGNK